MTEETAKKRERQRFKRLRRIEEQWHYGNLSAFRDSLEQAYQAGWEGALKEGNTKNLNRELNSSTDCQGIRTRYTAQFDFNGHIIHLGTYDDPISAARARDAKLRELYGERGQEASR